MKYIEISEELTGQRWQWPWDALKDVGDHFVVRDPKNIKNGRQSVHQFNKRSGAKIMKGTSVGGGFKVEKVL